MEISHRPVTSEDEPFLRQLIIATTAEELAAWAWPEPMRAQLLDIQYRGRRQGIASNYPEAAEDLILVDGEPAGWLVVNRNSGPIHLVDIVVASEKRGAGVGTAIIGELIAESDRTGRPVRLMVNVTNRALKLYERLGFRRTGGNEVQHEMLRTPAPR